MKTFTLKIEDEEIELRLKSSDAVKIESIYKVKLLDFIQDYSITTIVTLLRFMVKGGGKECSEKDAYDLYDKLVDNDWSVGKIITDIILPSCEASGLLTRSDLEIINKNKEQATQVSAN